MLLTISITHQPATDLGYLLHKNPGRHHQAELSFGTAHVYFPAEWDGPAPPRRAARRAGAASLGRRLCEQAPGTLRPTRSIIVSPGYDASEQAGIGWWQELTAAGEGMVVKPASVFHRGSRGIAQPGIKCRGREYLRIIYGPEYTAEPNLARLRQRSLGHKRSLALREFCLGIEALERFAAGAPLHRVHECVFGVLALESEPVDPRL